MNPSAPVWVSALSGGGSSSAPPVAVTTPPQRSMLDPNTAAFRPKTTVPPPTDRSAVSPPSFTRYVGNPVLSTSPSSGRPVSASSGAGYSQAAGGGPPPSSHRGMVFSNVAGGSGASPAGARIGPGYGYPPPHPHHHLTSHHHQHHRPSQHHIGGHIHHHHQGHGHHSGSSPNNATQIYSAKANTHWGSAGIPQNVQHTHHATNGAVLYNQPSQQKSQPPVSPPSSGTRGGSTASGSISRSPTALHEEILFTPSTRDIWAGTAAVQSDRALDSAIGGLMEEASLMAGNIDPEAQIAASSSDSVAVPAHPVVNTLLKSLSRDEAIDEGQTDAGVGSRGSAAHPSAWHHHPLQQQHATTPWTKLMVATATGAAPAAEKQAPIAEGSGRDVDTVQHLLAQLTQGSDRKAHAGGHTQIATTTTTTTTTTGNPPRATIAQSTASTTSAGSTSGAQRAQPKTTASGAVAVSIPAVVVPPAAIGGSPTSPEIRHGTTGSGSPHARRQGAAAGSSGTSPSAVDAAPLLDAQKSTPSSVKPPAPRSARLQQESQQTRVNDKASTVPIQETATLPADAAPRATCASSSSAVPQHHTRTEIAAIKLPAGSSRRWANRAVVSQLLLSSKETLRHIKILSFSKQYPEEVGKLFQGWASKGIPAPDDVFGAYYYYVVKKSGMELCMKHNGRGRAPGVGYGGCDFGNRGPQFKCRFHHVCLFCKGEDHGWFDESNCARYQQFRKELDKLKLVEQDVPELLDAYDTLP